MENLFTPDCIRTYTGKYVNVFNPTPDMFDIVDIAHALSKEQRFGNHLNDNYSVAQHSIICSEMAPVENKFTALCHDFSEAFLKDLPKPIKLKMPEYEKVEDNLMLCLSKKFGFQYPLPERVKEIDLFMLKREWNSLMLSNEKFGWNLMSQSTAKRKFMEAYKKLSKS